MRCLYCSRIPTQEIVDDYVYQGWIKAMIADSDQQWGWVCAACSSKMNKREADLYKDLYNNERERAKVVSESTMSLLNRTAILLMSINIFWALFTGLMLAQFVPG